MPIRIDIFIDFVCPFCFLVEPAIKELERDRDVEVTIHPFELRPDPVPTLRPEDDYLPRVWRQSVYPMARRVSMPLKLPTVSPQPRTEKAFMVLQLASERGLAKEYTAAMFSAFFRDDRDIGDDRVIIDVACTVGLSRADALAALRSEGRRARHRADQKHATDTIGVDSVPCIVVAGNVLRGVPSATRLKKVVDELAGHGADGAREWS